MIRALVPTVGDALALAAWIVLLALAVHAARTPRGGRPWDG